VAFEVIGAVGGVTQGVARLLGLSKSARLRRSINDHIKLYGNLRSEDELKEAAVEVAGLITLQTRQLVLREVIAANRWYDWSNLIVGVLLAAICAIPLLWILPPTALWHWPVVVLFGGLALAFLIFGLTQLRKQPTVEELTAASNEVAAVDPTDPTDQSDT
jgi:hypothetical protein